MSRRQPSSSPAPHGRAARRPLPGEPKRSWIRRWVRASPLPFLALAFIVAGLVMLAIPQVAHYSRIVWMAGLVTCGAPVVLHTVRGMIAGRFAADIVATLAILTSIVLLDPLPGLIVVLMQTGGEALERFAEGRATEAVRALEAEAPKTAHVVVGNDTRDVDAEAVQVGDLLLVRPGELIPCDGEVVDGRSHVDTARLTGEPTPVRAEPGISLMSGSVNQEGAITMRATAVSRESQYARIVELVRTAQASKSPLQRLADRYAVWFTPLTIAVAAIAYMLSGDTTRILAVLVVATPCPLILATPVAIIGGINRAARNSIVIRHGSGLEQLGKVRVAVFDKTGTLTVGMPEVDRVEALGGFTEREVLRLAAAVEHDSGHLLARSVVREATSRGIEIAHARSVVETPGSGVVGTVEDRVIAVGAPAFVAEHARLDGDGTGDVADRDAGLSALIAVDGTLAGAIRFADRLRPGLTEFFGTMHDLGFRRTILLSGDHEANVRAVAAAVGIDEAESDLLPQDKVAVVNRLVADGEAVLMVGDGINDAPAMSSATVGIALAGHGGGIAAEAADVVILTDDLARVIDAIRISRRSVRIALQSIGVGLGLSGGAMILAALGFIPPVAGAVLQEGIDVAVVLNALRASRHER